MKYIFISSAYMAEIILDSKLTHTVVKSHKNYHCWSVADSVIIMLCLEYEFLFMDPSLASMQSFGGLELENIISMFGLIIFSISWAIDSR